MFLKALKDIPSGRNQLVVGFYTGHCHGEQIFHTNCKLHAGHSICLLRSREQDTEVPPRTVLVSGFCWYKEASQGTNHHPGHGAALRWRGVAFRQQAANVGNSFSPWSLGVRVLHSSFSLSLFCCGLWSAPTRAESQSAACA